MYLRKIKDKQKYATFIGDLLSASLVELGHLREATVGIFFAAKGAKQRLIFDTGKANQEFVAPAYTQLPATGA